jgi:hypothetical protein
MATERQTIPEVRVADMDATEVQNRLDLPAGTMAWLESIERPATSDGPVLPDDAEAQRLLERLGANPADRAETLAARPDPDAHPELWWVLDRLYHEMLATMGAGVSIEGFRSWPSLRDGTGAVGRHLYVWLFLATLPRVRQYHAAKGIPDDISWKVLSGLGTEMARWRRISGKSGLHVQWILPLTFRGAVYGLGRLEFNRVAIALANGACGWALNIHIGNTLDPSACDESFANARAFFPHHFPEEPPTFFTCESWLMDPQLADYLPETSNILRFQRRFHLVPLPPQEAVQPDGDRTMLVYVFGRYEQPEDLVEILDKLPQDTTLRRAFVTHLRSGGHWHSRTGWFPF